MTYIRTLAIAFVMLGFAVLSRLVPHGRTSGALILVLAFVWRVAEWRRYGKK